MALDSIGSPRTDAFETRCEGLVEGAQHTIKSVQCIHNPATDCEGRAVDSPISIDPFQVQIKELSLLQLLFSHSTTCTPLTE
jgi:hypothetical protein